MPTTTIWSPKHHWVQFWRHTPSPVLLDVVQEAPSNMEVVFLTLQGLSSTMSLCPYIELLAQLAKNCLCKSQASSTACKMFAFYIADTV